MASPLMADVTPEQVWQGWQDASAAMGSKVAADSTTREGDALVLKNLHSGDAATGTASIAGSIRLKDNGDGTVTILLPDTYPVALHIPPTAGEADATATDLSFDVTMPGAKIIASGTPEAVRYATDAPVVDMKLSTINNVVASAIPISAEAHLAGVSANYGVASGGDQKLAEEFSIKSINVAVSGKDPKGGSDYDISTSLADLAGKIAMNLPAGVDTQNLEAALAKGFSFDTTLGFGATTFDVNVHDAGQQTQITGTTGSATMDVAMNADRISYATGTKAVSLKIISPDIPVADASLSYGSAGFSMVMPVAASDTPADFTLKMDLTDVAPSEAIWALIDPGKALPHDPATLAVDTKGKVTLTRSFLADATSLEAGQTDQPGQLDALDIDQFQVKAAGADVTAKGSFTFDNSDMTTYEGVPAPTGKIDIKALGVNALLDTLVKMGLVPKEQAMQGRMMLAMFANTKTDADEMTSSMEFKDKHFFANGQQLQ